MGQGCNLAIEDAEALAYLLRDKDNSENITGVLREFFDLRKDRARAVLVRAHVFGGLGVDQYPGEKAINHEFLPMMLSYQGLEHFLKTSKRQGHLATSTNP